MAPPSAYRIELLGDQHDRAAFSCSVDALDRYLHVQAGQDSRRRIASCFVLVAPDGSLAGYYTLSAAGIAFADLPAEVTRKLPRYPLLPAALMGRLAVDRQRQGGRLGELLLFDAFSRALRSELACYAFLVDAKAEAFYKRYEFRRLSGLGRRLYIPLADIARLFA